MSNKGQSVQRNSRSRFAGVKQPSLAHTAISAAEMKAAMRAFEAKRGIKTTSKQRFMGQPNKPSEKLR